ncbi:MAG: PilN domain-containing protein [Pseudomonadota bacterium]
MKQTVNLLRDELKPVVQHVTLSRVAAVAVLLLVLSGLGWGYTGWQNADTQEALNSVNQRLEQAQQQQKQLQQQLEQRKPSPQLAERSQQLDEQLTGQQQLNQRLAQQQHDQASVPDRLMAELFAVDIEGLWLTGFSSTTAGVSLVGKAIQANLLPRWMQRFQQQELLASSRFAVVDLDNDEQGNQTFSLTNSLPDKGDDSAAASDSPEQESP